MLTYKQTGEPPDGPQLNLLIEFRQTGPLILLTPSGFWPPTVVFPTMRAT